jgi:hypothetical protein
MWAKIDDWLRFTPTSWMSASIISFAVAAAATVLLGLIRRPGTNEREDPVC